MFKRPLEVTLNDVLMFELVHNNIFSINNMDDRELRESIVQDILMITMLEKEDKVEIDFDQHKLFRWIKPIQHSRVYEQMGHPEISGLIERKNGQIRIKDQKEILQATMDYCGHWYDGFTLPAGEEGIYTLNTGAIQEELDASGGDFDKFCDIMLEKLAPDLMDLDANVSGNTTMN